VLPGDAAVCWCSGRATRPYLTNRTYRENAGALTPIKATVSKRGMVLWRLSLQTYVTAALTPM
jgi:hypothetical protein